MAMWDGRPRPSGRDSLDISGKGTSFTRADNRNAVMSARL